MRDQIIRKLFHEQILRSAHKDLDTFVIDELGLKNGEIRADIAVLNGKLVGYEIKTEKDNLMRLTAQVSAYNEVFDKAYLIVSKNHLKKAVGYIPDWWGIYIINILKNNSYSFSCVRKSKCNKYQDSFSLSQLLWKDEALKIATDLLNHKFKAKVLKHEIYKVISATCSSKVLSKIVIKQLKMREGWRTNHKQLL